MPGACASRALAAAGLLLCLPALGAEPIDFKIVARPAHWGGLELPGKPSSHTQRRLHGAVIPHVQRLKESVKGHESYRIYFIKNGRQAQNVYALFGDDYSTMSLSTDDKSPLFQVPHPFGNDFGGVNRELIEVKPASEFDTWLTVGEDNGNSKSDISAVGLGTFDERLLVPDGAVFAMNPDRVPEGMDPMPKELEGQGAVLIGQVTVAAGTTFTGHFNAQGRSATDESDWQEYGICFSTGEGCQKHPVGDEL